MSGRKFISVNGAKLLELKAKELSVDPEYQRKLDEPRAKKIGENWDPKQGGFIVAALRDDGRVFVIDGQHRVWGLMLCEKGDTVLAVDVRVGLSQREEAELFYVLNQGRRGIRVSDAFRARLVAEEPDAVMINSIVQKAGLRITGTATKNGIAAIHEMEMVHKKFDCLPAVLEILKAWSRAKLYDPLAYDKRLVRYVGRFLFEFSTADVGMLSAKLIKFGRPELLIARITQELRGYCEENVNATAVNTILEIYNSHNRNKLTREDRGTHDRSSSAVQQQSLLR